MVLSQVEFSTIDTSELTKPILIEHFKRQGYDEAMVELIVIRAASEEFLEKVYKPLKP